MSSCKAGRQQSRSAFFAFWGRGRTGARGGAETRTQPNRDQHHILSPGQTGAKPETGTGPEPEQKQEQEPGHPLQRSRGRNQHPEAGQQPEPEPPPQQKPSPAPKPQWIFTYWGPEPDRGQWRAWGASLQAGLPESHLQTLWGINPTMSNGAGAQLQSCSSQSRKTLDYTQACRSDKEWRFFPLYGCGKNTTACPIAWTGYVRPVTMVFRWAGELPFPASIPSRPSPWRRVCRPNMFCPGRQGRRSRTGFSSRGRSNGAPKRRTDKQGPGQAGATKDGTEQRHPKSHSLPSLKPVTS